jgi:hypothetical protein
MKNKIFFSILILTTTVCYSQNNRGVPNKNIIICDLEIDTLTYEQFKNCTTISVKGKSTSDIISFYYSYFRDDNSTYEDIQGEDNIISQLIIDNTIKYQIKKAIIGDVMVKDGKSITNCGYRILYFK